MNRKPVSFAKVFTLLGLGFFALLLISVGITQNRNNILPDNDKYYRLDSNEILEIESSRWDTIRIYYHLSDDEIVTYDQGILLFIDSSNNEIHQILITVNGELINDKNIELIVDSDELDAFSYNPILKIKVRKEGLYSFISSSKEGYEENVLFEIGTKSGPNLRPIIIFLVIGILTFTIIKTKQIIKSKNTNIQDITKVLHNSKINPDDDAFKEFDKNVFDDYE